MKHDSEPSLASEDLKDDVTLWAAIESNLLADPEFHRAGQRLLTAQEALRAVSDELGWMAYLRVEDATSVRLFHICLRLVRWAFDAGLKHGARQP